MGQITLTFTKKPICLDKQGRCTIVKVGGSGHKFTMKHFQLVHGHDDSIPYKATLYCDGKPFLKCYNDGWGGDTELTDIPDSGLNPDEIKAEVEQYKYYCTIRGKKYTFNVSLDFIADLLAHSSTTEEEVMALYK